MLTTMSNIERLEWCWYLRWLFARPTSKTESHEHYSRLYVNSRKLELNEDYFVGKSNNWINRFMNEIEVPLLDRIKITMMLGIHVNNRDIAMEIKNLADEIKTAGGKIIKFCSEQEDVYWTSTGSTEDEDRAKSIKSTISLEEDNSPPVKKVPIYPKSSIFKTEVEKNDFVVPIAVTEEIVSSTGSERENGVGGDHEKDQDTDEEQLPDDLDQGVTETGSTDNGHRGETEEKEIEDHETKEGDAAEQEEKEGVKQDEEMEHEAVERTNNDNSSKSLDSVGSANNGFASAPPHFAMLTPVVFNTEPADFGYLGTVANVNSYGNTTFGHRSVADNSPDIIRSLKRTRSMPSKMKKAVALIDQAQANRVTGSTDKIIYNKFLARLFVFFEGLIRRKFEKAQDGVGRFLETTHFPYENLHMELDAKTVASLFQQAIFFGYCSQIGGPEIYKTEFLDEMLVGYVRLVEHPELRTKLEQVIQLLAQSSRKSFSITQCQIEECCQKLLEDFVNLMEEQSFVSTCSSV